MAYPPYIREKARQLRRDKKLTIDELADRLALPRTTIYYWVRDLPIERKPHREWPETARRKGNRAMQRKYRLLREEAYRQGADEFEERAQDPTFRDFVAMYIAEGYKKNRNTVSVANSSLDVMNLIVTWLRRLTDRPLRFTFQYHADQKPSELIEYWSGALDADPATFHPQRKSNSGQLNGRVWRCQYGVLTVSVHHTLLRARLEAWIDCLESEWRELDSTRIGV